MVGLLPSRSLKRAENSLVASFWSTSKAVVSTRPWAVSRPSEATSVEKISSPARRWPAATMPNSAACLMELMVSPPRSEEHTSELQSLMRISYAVFCLKKKNEANKTSQNEQQQLYTVSTNGQN